MTGVKMWKCGNCGHETPATDELIELAFQQYGHRLSRTKCPNCGSYTLNKAWDYSFTSGEFLIVKSHNGIGKGSNKNGQCNRNRKQQRSNGPTV